MSGCAGDTSGGQAGTGGEAGTQTQCKAQKGVSPTTLSTTRYLIVRRVPILVCLCTALLTVFHETRVWASWQTQWVV